MNLPDGYRSRAPTDDDLHGVGDLLLADQLDVANQPLLWADFIREQWSWLGFDLLEDAWVVHNAAGTFVAYGQVRLEGKDFAGSWGVVHPDHSVGAHPDQEVVSIREDVAGPADHSPLTGARTSSIPEGVPM